MPATIIIIAVLLVLVVLAVQKYSQISLPRRMFGKLRQLFRLLFRRLRFQPSSFRPFLNRIPTSLFLDNPFFYSFFLKGNLPALDSGEVAFYRILSFFILILGHTAIRSDGTPVQACQQS